jgi:hypothetical protein
MVVDAAILISPVAFAWLAYKTLCWIFGYN